MNLNDGTDHSMQYWQKLYFTAQTGDSSKKTDALRSMILEVQSARTNGFLSENSAQQMKSRLCEQLSNTVDDFSSQTGLNNFADAALDLVKFQKIESNLWKCNLDHGPETLCKFKSCSTKYLELDEIFSRKTDTTFPDFVTNLIDKSVQNPSAAQVKNESTKFQNDSGKCDIEQNNENTFPIFRQGNRNARIGKRNTPINNKNEINEKIGIVFKSSYSNTKSKRFACSKKKETLDFGEESHEQQPAPSFRTAKDQLIFDSKNNFKGINRSSNSPPISPLLYGSSKKSLGSRIAAHNKFIPPILKNDQSSEQCPNYQTNNKSVGDILEDGKLKNICPKMVELIQSEIMDHGPPVSWDDIAGLEFAKSTIKEIVVWPMLRPDLFTGLRGPPKGLLLFGPPGTGKTLIGKCIATQSNSTFFNISASSLTSKWIGDGEKMVRALFAVARTHLPAVIFIDEIDSLLTQRSESEHESSRRIKTEFLVQLDGATTSSDEQLLIVGATNRPQELDEAARRRLVKRLYIPLPEGFARRQIVSKLLSDQKHEISDEELDIICDLTEGYSGADMTNLCKEASLGPIRSISGTDIHKVSIEEVRAINLSDFRVAAKQVRASVSSKDLDLYLQWNDSFGSVSGF